jgi:hypothetical protein
MELTVRFTERASSSERGTWPQRRIIHARRAQSSRLIDVIAFLYETSLFFTLNMRKLLDFGAVFPGFTTGNYSFVPQIRIYRLPLPVRISTRDATVGGTTNMLLNFLPDV